MARIETAVGGASVFPFTQSAEVALAHAMGHRPMVQVLVKQPGGLYGFSGYGEENYGTANVYVPLPDPNYLVIHESTAIFRVLMNNYYDGEIVYL